MGKESGSFLLTSSLFCLLIFAFIYAAAFFTFDSYEGKHHLWSSAEKIDRNMEGREQLSFLLRRLVRGEDRVKLEATGYSCYSDLHSELCIIDKPVRIKNHTVYAPSREQSSDQSQRFVQPYPRKEDQTAMKAVSPVQILHGNTDLPACHFTHDIPAMVFSSGGFTGNLFHEFNEVIIPLFITSRHFRSRLRFVITDYKPWMVEKYKRILNQLSAYNAINPAEDGGVHCFPGAVVGLKYHNNLALNASDIPGGYSMSDFKHFLRKSYSLKITNVSEMKQTKPVLILISRQTTRKFLNEDEMTSLMEELGFQVTVAPPYNMSSLDMFAQVVNSCSVMVGAHGAGLGNSVLLPAGAVMVQVVPLGLDWASETYYGNPAREMGVQSLEYKIGGEESSLFHIYGRDHPIIADPESILLKGYVIARAVYIDGQDMKINLVRFREILVQARKLLGNSLQLK